VTETPTLPTGSPTEPAGSPTEPTAAPDQAEPVELPPEAIELPPEAFTERAAAARARGLPGPYIAGGDDPDLAAELARERPYVRLLIGMVVAIVLGGFILGAIGMLIIEAGLG
jgi:hypothetical protein